MPKHLPKTAMTPDIAILIPAYNHAPHLNATLQSLLTQTHTNWELILVDDASTDHTQDILQNFPPDPRITHTQNPHNQGVSATLNTAFALSRAPHIAILNSDDLYTPTRLERLLDTLHTQNADLIGTDITLIDTHGHPITQHWWIDAFNTLKTQHTGDWPATLLAGNLFMTSSNFLLRRTLWTRLGGFRPGRYCQDYDFLLRAAAEGAQLAWLNEPLLHYRWHTTNTITESPLAANQEAFALLRQHAPALIADTPTQTQRLTALCAQLARIERHENEIHLALKHHALTQKDHDYGRLIADRDQWIADRDRWIADRDQEIAQRDDALAALHNQLNTLHTQLNTLHTHNTALTATLTHAQQNPLRITLSHWKNLARTRLGLPPSNQNDRLNTTTPTLLTKNPTEFSSESTAQTPTLIRGGRGGGAQDQETHSGLKQSWDKIKTLLHTAGPLPTPPKRLTGFAQLRAHIEAHPHRLKALSFDVFDTLVFRCIEPPTWLTQRLCQRLAPLTGLSPETLLQLRQDAETALRTQALTDGHDHECHLDDLLNAWATRILAALTPEQQTTLIQTLTPVRPEPLDFAQDRSVEGHPHPAHPEPLDLAQDRLVEGHSDFTPQRRVSTLTTHLLADELHLETLALHAKPGAALFLAWARAQGLRLIAISDMYLGKTHIQTLLNRLGLGPALDALYVSSEHRLGKHTGRLFAHVLQDQNLQAHELAHIGDNFHADTLQPHLCGIQGLFFDQAHERTRRRLQTLSAQMTHKGGIWPGRFHNEILLHRLNHDPRAQRDDFFFRYGLEVLGPIYSVFMQGFIERLTTARPRAVFFLARDGYLFMKMYEAYRHTQTPHPVRPEPFDFAQDRPVEGHPNLTRGFNAQKPNLPPPTYAYASRKVICAAAIAEGLTHEQTLLPLYNPKQQGLLSILKTYSLDPSDYQTAAQQHGLTPIDAPLKNLNDPRLLAFLADPTVQDQIKKTGQAARKHLHTYFTQLDFFGQGTVILCDIGWNGTIQRFMANTFGHRPDYPTVHGLYFALLNTLHTTPTPPKTGPLEGLMLDGARQNPCERAAFDFEELFEQGARSPEGTTLGYTTLPPPLPRGGEGGGTQDPVRPEPVEGHPDSITLPLPKGGREGNNTVTPLLKPDTAPDRQAEIASNPRIHALQQGILLCWEHHLATQTLTGLDHAALKPHALAQTERAVVYPTKTEAHCIGTLAHSEDFGHDDILDLTHQGLGWRTLLRPHRLPAHLRTLAWRYAPFAHTPGPFGALAARCAQLWRLRKKKD